MTTTDTGNLAARLRRQLSDELQANGDLRTPQWRTAAEAVPRHVFLPSFFRSFETPGETMWEPITQERVGTEEWLKLAYSNETWVTQLDHRIRPSDVEKPVPGSPTSSSSLPGLVLLMLEELQVHDDSQVLEIGTGTGYSTSLLAHRLGDDQVTSIEVDPRVATCAAAAINDAGLSPTLVTGDGLAGHPGNAPYDRVIATCSVRRIPPSWIAQTKPGGAILTTLSGWMQASSGLIRLDVGDNQTAEGRYLGDTISFMPARAHDRPPLSGDAYTWVQGPGEERPTSLTPHVVQGWTDWTTAYIAQLAAPTAQSISFSTDSGPVVDYVIDEERESFAALLEQPEGSYVVRQRGPVALWDAVEDAITAWRAAGSPGLDKFHLTVTPTEQTVWLDTPSGQLSWTLP